MRVRMLQTRRGTEDGFVVRLYQAGRDYHITDYLAKRFIASGYAIAV